MSGGGNSDAMVSVNGRDPTMINVASAPSFDETMRASSVPSAPLDKDQLVKVDPAFKSLPGVNPVATVPVQARFGKVPPVIFNQSQDLRGDIDYRVGYHSPEMMANPRAFGALQDRIAGARAVSGASS
jgi:hypothetical protein